VLCGLPDGEDPSVGPTDAGGEDEAREVGVDEAAPAGACTGLTIVSIAGALLSLAETEPPADTTEKLEADTSGEVPTGLSARPMRKKQTKTSTHSSVTAISPRRSEPADPMRLRIQRLPVRTVLMRTGTRSAESPRG
jgi:hypothetical protein